MDGPEYEYRGLIASSWDLLRGDTSLWPDRSFYFELIQATGQPVLDVGCGTGRLLLDYQVRGIDIDGVDNSPEMLELCHQKANRLGLRPNLYQQSMEELALPRRYRTILVPSSSFQLVTDRDAARRTMQRIEAHLLQGGLLAMSFMILSTGQRVADWKLIAESERPEDGALVRRFSRLTFDLEQQLEHTQDRYEVLVDGHVVMSESHARSPATRWYSQAEVVLLYRNAGLNDVRVLAGFSHTLASGSETLFCVTGRRYSA